MQPGAIDDEPGVVPPEPAARLDHWGPRANTNIQESAILFALNRVAKNKEMFLENYWLKNKRAVEQGRRTGPVYAWVIPANQHAQGERGRGGERARARASSSTRATRRSRPARCR